MQTILSAATVTIQIYRLDRATAESVSKPCRSQGGPLHKILLHFSANQQSISARSLSGSTFPMGSHHLSGIVFLACAYYSASFWLRPALADNLSTRPPEVILWYHAIAWPSSSIGLSQLWDPLPGIHSLLNCALLSLPRDLSRSFYKLLKIFLLGGPWSELE